MASSGDPVSDGLIKSLAHPGGNVTGLSSTTPDIIPKQIEMLRDIVPNLGHAIVLVNPDHPTNIETLTVAQAAAKFIGITLSPIKARTSKEIENAFSQATQQKAGGLVLSRDGFFNQQVRQIAELAKKHRLPTIAGLREYVEAGGLMCYGPSLNKQFRRAATYVDKIFRGAKPADLPVEQPTTFELFINGKTAKALGLKIPQSLLIMADKVIE
jgi:putative ABC transport system substrate-binding protein